MMSARCVTATAGVLMVVLALTACGPMTFVVGVTPGDQRMVATVVEADGEWGSDRVAIVDVAGLIYNANKPGLLSEGENPVSVLYEKLEAARRDPKVKALILRLNTPGGTVTGSDAMYRCVKRFREQTGKPVIVLMMDVAASGGYYLACAGDRIIAYPTTVTGSIGVIVQTISVKDGLSRIGVHAEAITSGPNKDVGSPFSTMTPEHRQILQGLVADFYGKFTDVVKQSRPRIPAERFAALTDGRVMSGTEALKAGLVDQIGDLHDSFAAAKQVAGLKHADLILYHRPLEYVGSPYAGGGALRPMAGNASGGAAVTQVNLLQLNVAESWDRLAGTSVGFYYLWDPGLW